MEVSAVHNSTLFDPLKAVIDGLFGSRLAGTLPY
jgi:hypothetical protein